VTAMYIDEWAGAHHLILEGAAADQFIVEQISMVLGSDATNDIVLAAPSVSPLHALLLRDAAGVILLDLESDAGTCVNGRLIAPDHPLRLADGDQLRFGDVNAYYSAPPQGAWGSL
jgi:pSer/pThr/pTyr-binding forkhead associated (FHA) protein